MKEKEIIEYTSSEIISDLDNNFIFTSKPFANYCNQSNPLWKKCIDIVNDVEMMNKIIFCNNYLQIPPAQTTAAVLNEVNLSDYDKKFIGAFWGYVFNSFGYKESKKVTSKKTSIKTARYYIASGFRIVVLDNINK